MIKIREKFKPREGARTYYSVLVVDDNTQDRLFAQRVLSKSFFEVYLARDGETGIDFARQLKPDCVILDCLLPGIDGFNVCRAIKTNPETQGIPVIFLTVVENGYNVIQCYEAGANTYIQKPVSARQLVKQIKTAIHDEMCVPQNPLTDQTEV